ncbi:MAG: TetR/AcrR family transcriptional regulator [Deltaproteobacteria bacterium]|nr:TetR/AcrR family transcriptional regulator [Deltaproteobacteria bacterium]
MTRHVPEAERRLQILSAARGIFIERGYLAARVEDIARRADLSKGALYFYFPSKRALFDALVDEEYERTLQILLEAENAAIPSTMKLFRLGRDYLEYFTAIQDPPRFFLLMTEMAIRDDGVRQHLRAIHDRFVQGISQVVAQGVSEGLIRPVDPQAVAVLLKGLVDGLSGQAAAGIRLDVPRLATDGVDVILHGLLLGGGLERS